MVLWTIGVHIFFKLVLGLFFDIYSGVELLGHTFSFLRTSILLSKKSAPIYIPIIVGGSFSHILLPTLVICVLSDGRWSISIIFYEIVWYSSDIAWSEALFLSTPKQLLKSCILFYFNHSNDPLFPNWEKRKVESKTRSLGHSLNCNLKNLCWLNCFK